MMSSRLWAGPPSKRLAVSRSSEDERRTNRLTFAARPHQQLLLFELHIRIWTKQMSNVFYYTHTGESGKYLSDSLERDQHLAQPAASHQSVHLKYLRMDSSSNQIFICFIHVWRPKTRLEKHLTAVMWRWMNDGTRLLRLYRSLSYPWLGLF